MTVPALRLERLYVTSPVRRYLHQPLVTGWFVRRLRELDKVKFGRKAPLRILEIGCGTGAGLLALDKKFPNAVITGVEIDKKMARVARRRIDYSDAEIGVITGSITDDLFPPNSFDLIVSYGCLHHIPDWQAVVAKLSGLLVDGGYLAAEEYYAPLLEHPLFSLVGVHPPQRFRHGELAAALTENGLQVVAQQKTFEVCGLTLGQKG